MVTQECNPSLDLVGLGRATGQVPRHGFFGDGKTELRELGLTDADMNDLKREASGSGLFCQGCGQCLQHCSAELPIPDLMRAYMYAYGYRQPALAHSLLASLELPRQVCEDCSSCPVVCLNGWNVVEKIRDIVRLRDVPSSFLV
jgi:ferredoxin